jgi:hypothetical protein
MATLNYPRKIPVNPLFDVRFNSSVNSQVAVVTWDLVIPIDTNAYLQGKSIIECIPECMPDINSTTVLNYLNTIESV